MRGQLRGLAAPLVKLTVFALVTILASLRADRDHHQRRLRRPDRPTGPQFTDVAGLVDGDEVRIAGVRVGQVTGIGLADQAPGRTTAGRRGRPARSAPTSGCRPAVQATIRYRNLVGQRYIALTEGDGSSGRDPRRADDVIPLAQTTPALDLTALFGGFQPLLAGAVAGGREPAVLRDHPGLPGRGRHHGEPARARRLADQHRLADQDARHRQRDRQPEHRDRHPRRPRPAAVGPGGHACSSSSAGCPRTATRSSTRCRPSTGSRSSTTGLLEQARAPLAADIQALGDLSTNLADTGDLVEDFLQTRPDQARPDHPHGDQRQLVQLLPVPAGGYVVLPGPDDRTASRSPRTFDFDSGAEGCR